MVGWLIVFWPWPIVLRNNEARTLRLSLGALTEILALALAARNKRSLSDEGKNSAPRQFLGQPAFAPYPLIILCPEAGGRETVRPKTVEILGRSSNEIDS